eukprot:scaffold60618_cov72-Phaeocystis_antarctica.AAC.1
MHKHQSPTKEVSAAPPRAVRVDPGHGPGEVSPDPGPSLESPPPGTPDYPTTPMPSRCPRPRSHVAL